MNRLLLAFLVFLSVAFSACLSFAQNPQARSAPLPCARDSVRLSSDELIRLVVKRTPVEPPMLERLTLHGAVTAEVCVDKRGRVVGIQILSGHPMAQGPVLDSLRKWKFAPYMLKGHALPVGGTLDVPFDFGAPAPTSPPSR